MTEGLLFIDQAVDVIDSGRDSLRVLTPYGGFTVRDPVGVVRRVTSQCRDGATREDVLSAFESSPERNAAHDALSLLERRRVLRTQKQREGSDPFAHWLRHLAGSNGPNLLTLEIVGDGVLAGALKETVGSIGFVLRGSETCLSKTCLVAALDAPDMPRLRALNAQAHAESRTFLPIWLERSVVNWGPLTPPKATGCLECLYHREQAARRRGEAETVGSDIGLSVSGVVAELGAIFATGELARWTYDAHINSDLGMAWRFDLLNLSFEGSRVLRIPRCSVCGISDRTV